MGNYWLGGKGGEGGDKGDRGYRGVNSPHTLCTQWMSPYGFDKSRVIYLPRLVQTGWHVDHHCPSKILCRDVPDTEKAGYRISSFLEKLDTGYPAGRISGRIFKVLTFFSSILQLIIHLSIVLFTFFSFSPNNFPVFEQKFVNWIENSIYPVYPAFSIRPAGYPAWPDIRYIPNIEFFGHYCHFTCDVMLQKIASTFQIIYC